MDIIQLTNRHARLTKAHQKATSEEMIAYASGNLSEAELDARHEARLSAIAELEQGGAEYQRAIDFEIAHEAGLKKRTRWRKFTQGVWHTKPHDGDPIDYTKGDRAALVALMYVCRGKRRFSVAYQYMADKCGASRSTVKRLIKKLEAAGLVSITENRISRDRNEWNTFTILSDKLLNWAKRHFSKKTKKVDVIDNREGVKSEPDLRTLKGSYTTEDKNPAQNKEQPTTPPKPKLCSKKAERYVRVPPPEALEPETFMPVARGALEEIGYSQPEDATEAEILDEIETLRDRYQPNFDMYWWNRFQFKHGKRRTALAFLETQIMVRVRKVAHDERPWNEREPIKNKNGYLYGILKQPREKCRPEISIGALLHAREDCTLPAALMQSVEAHIKGRGGLGRQDNSAARV